MHDSKQCVSVGNIDELLPGLPVACQTNTSAPTYIFGKFDRKSVPGDLVVPGITVGARSTVQWLSLGVLALLEADGVAGGATRWAAEISASFLSFCLKQKRWKKGYAWWLLTQSTWPYRSPLCSGCSCDHALVQSSMG